MTKKFWLLMIVSSIAWAVFSCSSAIMTGVPQGSVLVGVYQGTFNGVGNEGTIEVKLYRSPDGGRPFFGHFLEEGSYLNFKGEIRKTNWRDKSSSRLKGPLPANYPLKANR